MRNRPRDDEPEAAETPIPSRSPRKSREYSHEPQPGPSFGRALFGTRWDTLTRCIRNPAK